MGRSYIFLTLLFVCFLNSASTKLCSSDIDCNNANFTFPTGICLNSTNLPEIAQCNCLYSCLQLNSLTNKCELKKCYNLSVLENSADMVCIPLYPNANYLTVILSGILFGFGVADIILGHWYIAIIKIFFGVWVFVSYVTNILIYMYFKPYPDTWHTQRRYNKVCCICCSQHSIITLFYFIWWIVDLFVFSINNYTTTVHCG